jgi:hypothetical protein
MTRGLQKRMLKHNTVTLGPKKSVFRHSLNLRIPETILQSLLYKRLQLYAYSIQLQPDASDTKNPNRVSEANVMLNESDYVFLKPCSHDWNTWHTCVTCEYLPRRGSSTLAQISNTSPFPPAVGRCDTSGRNRHYLFTKSRCVSLTTRLVYVLTAQTCR